MFICGVDLNISGVFVAWPHSFDKILHLFFAAPWSLLESPGVSWSLLLIFRLLVVAERLGLIYLTGWRTRVLQLNFAPGSQS